MDPFLFWQSPHFPALPHFPRTAQSVLTAESHFPHPRPEMPLACPPLCLLH
jgi:hypothetical protein